MTRRMKKSTEKEKKKKRIGSEILDKGIDDPGVVLAQNWYQAGSKVEECNWKQEIAQGPSPNCLEREGNFRGEYAEFIVSTLATQSTEYEQPPLPWQPDRIACGKTFSKSPRSIHAGYLSNPCEAEPSVQALFHSIP